MFKNSLNLPLFVISFLLLTLGCQKKVKEQEYAPSPSHISFWLTNIDKSELFERQDIDLAFENTSKDHFPTIEINEEETFQSIDGFGFTLTEGSAKHLLNLISSKRKNLLMELFDTTSFNIGVSYLRVPLGASDLSDRVYSYNDLLPGKTDTALTHFSLEPDKKVLIPILKEILAINPKIKIMATPWSPPDWMKTNRSAKGGSLKPEYYNTYARYFGKYVKAMQAEGIRIDAVSIQHHPFHDKNNPSMLMMPAEMEDFVKNHLGPLFKKDTIDTKIVIYDQNPDIVGYPISILNNAKARKYIDGSAFNLYGGNIEALSEVHKAHPDKNIYFTEQWIGKHGEFEREFPYHIKTLIIGGTRNWCKIVLEYNLASDEDLKPYTEGGCSECLGALTIENGIQRNPAYYIIAHASKFVRPGSVRIGSTMPEYLNNVAFKTPSGNYVIIVENDAKVAQTFNIKHNGKIFTSTLDAKSVATYVW